MRADPLIAPHRPLFLVGGLLWVSSTVWWMVQLWEPTSTPLDATILHGLLMGLSFMPCFIAGFCFTTVPRWLGLPPVDARRLSASITALLLGWLLVLAAAGPLASMTLLTWGLALAALGLAGLSGQLLGLCRQAAAGDHKFGLSPATLRDWEQGRRSLDRTARALLKVIDHAPDTVERAQQVA